nr:PREDICTED: parathymosin-like [Daucus carota subsp. sativus]
MKMPFEDNSEREPIHDNAAANEEENAAANEEENAAEDGDENAAEDGDDNKAENEDDNKAENQDKMADDLFDEAEIDDDSSVGEYNSADERMAEDSCDEDGDEYPEFNELTDMENPEFRAGMLFTSGKVF